MARQITLAVFGHHFLSDVVELDVLDAAAIFVVFDRLVNFFVRLHSLLEIL